MAEEKGAKGSKTSRLNFNLELNCACKPPICPHAAPGVAKLLQAAYSRGRADGVREAVQGVARAAAKAGIKVEVQQPGIRVRQVGSRRSQ